MESALSPHIVRTEESKMLNLSLKDSSAGKPMLVEWWSRHELTDDQKISLCLVYETPVNVICKNPYIHSQEHFVELLKNALSFPYVIAPALYLKYAQKCGLSFGTFSMDREDRDHIYSVNHSIEGEFKRVVYGTEIERTKSRYS